MDSDLCGFCTSRFAIRGFAYTVGGASASGQLAIVQAAQAVLTRQVDACIALGALMDLSYWECRGLRALGAMGSDRYPDEPALACRPFDRDRPMEHTVEKALTLSMGFGGINTVLCWETA